MKSFRLVLGILVIIILAACASSNQDVGASDNNLVISGSDIRKSYSRADLEALPSVQAVFNDVIYLGVPVADLMKDAGFNPQQVKAVKAVASDGFTVNYDSSQFLSEGFTVAYATVGGELSSDDGTFRIVFPGAEGKLNPRMLVELQIIQ